MIERQRVQELVVHAHAAVDDAADILPHHGFMGQHRALGQRFRAAGVDDLREIAAVDGRLEVRAVGMKQIVEGGEARRRRGGILARQPDHLLDRAILRARGARRLDEIGAGREQLCAGAFQDEIDLVRIEHEVDRHQHRADPRHREAQRGEGMRIAREHGETVALPDAEPEQAAAEPVADRIHLGKGPAHAAAAHRELVRLAARRAAQEIADGMLARFRDGGSDVAGHVSLRVMSYLLNFLFEILRLVFRAICAGPPARAPCTCARPTDRAKRSSRSRAASPANAGASRARRPRGRGGGSRR